MIVLDTNVLLSELARPSPDAAAFARARTVAPAALATTAVTEAEMRLGVALPAAGRRRDALAMAMERLFAGLLGGRVLPFDRAAAVPYTPRSRRPGGRPVSSADAMIAAIVVARGADALATRNTLDFEGSGIALINPWVAPT